MSTDKPKLGRPSRAATPSRTTVTIRLTEKEHEWLTKASEPMSLSAWFRRLAFESHEVVALLPPDPGELQNLSDLRAHMAMMDLKARTALSNITDPEKREAVDALFVSIRRLLGMVVVLAKANPDVSLPES